MTHAPFPAARKGILKQLSRLGGSAPIAQLHEFSTARFQVAHREFSLVMEGLVGEGLVAWNDGVFSLTDQGREACKSLLL